METNNALLEQEVHIDNRIDDTIEFFQLELMCAWDVPPDITVSEWADRYRRLSSESSNEPGRWNTDRAPYQREIMDAVSSSDTQIIVIKSSAQVGKTEILNNVIGYYIDYDPAPIMYVMPTEDLAKAYSEDRLAPMIRDCPTLTGKVSEVKSRDGGNKILRKKFNGGQITMIGANTPSKLSSRPIRVILADEIDRFPASSGKEGDPLQLAIKRTATFWNRKIIMASTPTIKGASKIDAEFESSTKEELNIQCPNCGEFQPYVWDQLKFEHESGTSEFKLLGYVCKSCGVIEKEQAWKKQPIKWVAEHPERKNKRGFHLNEMASPWRSWSEIITDFLEAKRQGPEMLKVWTNTSLGESWEEEGDLDPEEILAKRRQYYNCEVPKDAVVLTAGVDVQDNRLEYEVVGWGRGKESWGIEYGVLMGDPGQAEVWKQLDDVLFRSYKRSDGLDMQIWTTCIDTGGHFTSEAYAYCKKKEVRRVWGIKGQGGNGVPFVQRPKARNKAGVWLFIIGVNVGKDTITSRLKVNFESGKGEVQDGFCHFPMEAERGYDEQYFNGLTSEYKSVSWSKGKATIEWKKKKSGGRNEPFDIRNYATAAMEILNPQLDVLYERLNSGAGGVSVAKNEPKKRRKSSNKGVDAW